MGGRGAGAGAGLHDVRADIFRLLKKGRPSRRLRQFQQREKHVGFNESVRRPECGLTGRPGADIAPAAAPRNVARQVPHDRVAGNSVRQRVDPEMLRPDRAGGEHAACRPVITRHAEHVPFQARAVGEHQNKCGPRTLDADYSNLRSAPEGAACMRRSKFRALPVRHGANATRSIGSAPDRRWRKFLGIFSAAGHYGSSFVDLGREPACRRPRRYSFCDWGLGIMRPPARHSNRCKCPDFRA